MSGSEICRIQVSVSTETTLTSSGKLVFEVYTLYVGTNKRMSELE